MASDCSATSATSITAHCSQCLWDTSLCKMAILFLQEADRVVDQYQWLTDYLAICWGEGLTTPISHQHNFATKWNFKMKDYFMVNFNKHLRSRVCSFLINHSSSQYDITSDGEGSLICEIRCCLAGMKSWRWLRVRAPVLERHQAVWACRTQLCTDSVCSDSVGK